MNERSNQARAPDEERKVAIGWLRNVLSSIVETAPLSPWIKRKTASMIRRLPDWLVVNWAEALNIDFIKGYQLYPDMADSVRSDKGRQMAQHYLESRDAMPAANCLQQLVPWMVRRSRMGKLPMSREIVEREICALALAPCTPDGWEFAEQASSALKSDERANHHLIDYQIALVRGDKERLGRLDDVLAGGRYGKWISERIGEIKCLMELDTPQFYIKYVERTPQWDSLWENIFLGGENE